jgi:Gnt-I system high-affinity gluconate transporter
MPLLIVAGAIVLLLALILLKVKPLYALLIVSIAVGLAEGLSLLQTLQSIATGIWDTLSSTAAVLCLGAMFGKIIEVSGAAQQITQTMLSWFGKKNMTWGVMLTGLIVGIPMFYNAGFVILVPLIFSIASSAQVPLLWVGIPMAASLSVTHGFLPPHPGPTAIAQLFHVEAGKVLIWGAVIAIPAVILAGPILSNFIAKLNITPQAKEFSSIKMITLPKKISSFFIALLPVIIISAATLLSSFTKNIQGNAITILSQPAIALTVSLSIAFFVFKNHINKSFSELIDLLYKSIREIAMIILIIAAGGGFKQVLADSGVSNYIKDFAAGLNYSPLLLAWLIAALMRVSIGSATVAALTTAGIVLPMISLPGVKPELMVLAIGAGSLMLSHVNDTGFWMFKEYFNLSVKQTFLSWTLMETIVSLTGLAGVLILNQLT